MNKKIISKVGKRHRPEIDMMEFMQLESIREFDLDRDVISPEDIESLLFEEKPIKKKSLKEMFAKVENEKLIEFDEDIENNEV